MSFDIRSIWLLAAVLSSSAGVLVLVLRRSYTGYLGRALTYWGGACISFGGAYGFAAASQSPMYSILPVGLASMALILEYVAVAELKQQPVSKAWIILPPLMTLIVFFWFSSVQRNITIGLILLNAIRAALMVRIAFLFYRTERDKRIPADILSSGIFALMTLSTAGVIFSFLRSGHLAPDYNFDNPRTIYNITAAVVAQSVVFSLFLLAITERLNRDLKRLAMIDPLTELYNRRGIEEIGVHEVSGAKRTGQPLSLFMIDLDHFKQFNDAHGHVAGDQILKAAANALRHSLRAETYIGRWGGDEFCALLPGTNRNEAAVAAERVMKAFRDLEIPIEGQTIRLEISIGIVSQLGSVAEFTLLVHMADTALYQAKETGRRTFAFA